MKKIFILLFLLCFNPKCFAENLIEIPDLDIEKSPLPPFKIRKVKPYEYFTTFDFKDIYGKQWTNKTTLTKPIIFLTGKWALRHDIKKWAHHLALKYSNFCDIVWIFNPEKTEFANHREKAEKTLKEFPIGVPIIIDNHSIIGRSLKIEYDIPTIIGITRNNTLGFVYESPINQTAIDRVEVLMFTKLFKH